MVEPMAPTRRPQGSPITLTGDTIDTPGAMPSPCRIWKWAKNDRGYGNVQVDGRKQRAHRVFYERYCCAIQPGLTLDHLCRNHSCVNWEHLEPVTHRENTLRGEGPAAKNAKKTHCPGGHEYDTVVASERRCRTCQRKHVREHRARRRARKAEAA